MTMADFLRNYISDDHPWCFIPSYTLDETEIEASSNNNNPGQLRNKGYWHWYLKDGGKLDLSFWAQERGKSHKD